MKIYSKTLGNGQNIFWETQYLILTQLYVKKTGSCSLADFRAEINHKNAIL